MPYMLTSRGRASPWRSNQGRRRRGSRASPPKITSRRAGRVSPFAAPSAAERLLEDVLTSFPTLAVARALLPADQFRLWIRPRVYDAKSQPDPELREALDRDELTAILAPPATGGDATLYCPRCGAVYREGTGCSDCPGVLLQQFPNLPRRAPRG